MNQTRTNAVALARRTTTCTVANFPDLADIARSYNSSFSLALKLTNIAPDFVFIARCREIKKGRNSAPPPIFCRIAKKSPSGAANLSQRVSSERFDVCSRCIGWIVCHPVQICRESSRRGSLTDLPKTEMSRFGWCCLTSASLLNIASSPFVGGATPFLAVE